MIRWLFIFGAICFAVLSCEKSSLPEIPVSAPAFYPESGTYITPQNVTITCSETGAVIRYTLDETEPTTSSFLYAAPILADKAVTIKARAFKSKMKPSDTITSSYDFNVGQIFILPENGVYTEVQTVRMYVSTPGTQIRYTTDGTEPTESSALYSTPINADGNMTIRAKGFIEGWNPYETISVNYSFNPAQPTFSQSGGIYYDEFILMMNSATVNASIRYTIDNSEPSETSLLYENPINITNTAKIKARAFRENWNTSITSAAYYELKVTKPICNPVPGNFAQEQNVTITCQTSGAKIFYTTDDSEPTLNSNVYSTPLSITANTILRAKAFRTGWTNSETSSGYYYFYVSAPSISPNGGNYTEPQTIALLCSTPGTELRYTLDNSEPTFNSILYTNPILISSSQTVKAKAFKTGWYSSSTASANFTIVPLQTVSTPVFSPVPGEYGTSQVVSIACSTPGAVIRFTSDGSEPTTSSMIYNNPITVYESTTFRARGFKYGWNTSNTAFAQYNINIFHEQLVYVQGGTFNMGCTNGSGDDDEFPVHPVTLSSFYISNHEVTQSEYCSVTGNNPSLFPISIMHPVDNVSFYDAVAYCNLRSLQEQFMPCYEYIGYGNTVSDWPMSWNTTTHNNIICHFEYDGYRLPTEAEWEFAAKGGVNSQNYLYSGSNNIDAVAWYGSNSNNQTHPVCQKAPNEIGIYDMTGNAWEIVWDWYTYFSYTPQPVLNPQGPSNGNLRVFRGGMWQADPWYQRVANRSSAYPNNISATYGFRVARSIN